MRLLGVVSLLLAGCTPPPCGTSHVGWGSGQSFVSVVRDGVWTSFDAGESCGTRADGRVECVDALAGVAREWPASPPLATLAGGDGFACGVEFDGSVFCVDANGDALPRPDGAFDHVFVDAWPCALAEDQAMCWLGDGWVGRHGEFVRVAAASGSACALAADGSLDCWDQQGELEPSRLPDQPWDDISAECGMSDGKLVCADGFADDCDATPGATGLGVSGSDWCFLDADGRPICRTDEDAGVRGLPVPELDGLISVSMGDEAACGLDADGTVTCWGAGGVIE